jgi:hypothetical protein
VAGEVKMAAAFEAANELEGVLMEAVAEARASFL